MYLLNQSIIDEIPTGRAVSLEREIFPVLAGRGKLYGWRHEGFWYDIGTIPGFVRANMELLGRFGEGLIGRDGRRAELNGVRGPSFVSEGSSLDREASVGPRAILSENVRVMGGAAVHDSIVFEESVLGENCVVEGSVIGEGTTVGKNVVVGKGSVVAGEVRLPDDVRVKPGSIVLN